MSCPMLGKTAWVIRSDSEKCTDFITSQDRNGDLYYGGFHFDSHAKITSIYFDNEFFAYRGLINPNMMFSSQAEAKAFIEWQKDLFYHHGESRLELMRLEFAEIDLRRPAHKASDRYQIAIILDRTYYTLPPKLEDDPWSETHEEVKAKLLAKGYELEGDRPQLIYPLVEMMNLIKGELK